MPLDDSLRLQILSINCATERLRKELEIVRKVIEHMVLYSYRLINILILVPDVFFLDLIFHLFSPCLYWSIISIWHKNMFRYCVWYLSSVPQRSLSFLWEKMFTSRNLLLRSNVFIAPLPVLPLSYSVIWLHLDQSCGSKNIWWVIILDVIIIINGIFTQDNLSVQRNRGVSF